MKKDTRLSFQSFEFSAGEKEEKFFNWIIFVDVLFLVSTLALMLVAENIFHMNVLGWKEYWILFFSNAIFFGYVVVALKSNFKIWLLKYLLAIFIPFLFGGWIYFSDPAYSKVLFSGPVMMLPMVGFIFYNSRLLLIASFTIATMFGFLFFNFPRIGSVFQPYEIYLIYMFLLMGTILYFSLIERTKIFLKELLGARGELEDAKTVLEIKIKARTKELKELNRNLEGKVTERTKELEEARDVLEIKIGARTKELEELNRNLEGKVTERTKELQERVGELERFHELTIGRELKMVELKKEIKKLEKKGEKDN